MTSLGEILGAMISQIDRGRAQADIAVLEIAQIYKDNPVLRGFPVPRVALDEVRLDLKLAISAMPVSERMLTPEAKSTILSKVDRLVGSIPKQMADFRGLYDECRQAQTTWKKLRKEKIIHKQLELLLTEGEEISPALTAECMASTIKGYLVEIMAGCLEERKDLGVKISLFIQKSAPSIQETLKSKILEIIENALADQLVDPKRVHVLVTASELESVPPEKITTLHLSLRESDRMWMKTETEDGEIVDRLIPS
jgi:hypothetical protein